MRLLLLLLCLSPGAAAAEGERPGAFDYYVMALSWSPNWCKLEGEARDAPQCDRDMGWALHGLWPQNERGWPSYCPSAVRAPSRAMTRAMSDLMGDGGSAWHQWKKHGTCAGLEAGAYFDLAREAYGSVVRPDVFRRLADPVRLPARVVEEAFLEGNPALRPDMLTVTCRDGHIQEVRICLTKALVPRNCGADVVRDCRATDALLEPIR
ncbi:MAG: ribonuclease T2 family protein [Shimia sp.]